jgi:hypothetical protein
MLFIASVPNTEAQQRVNFKNKKLSELNTSWYPIPDIWSTFSEDSDDFVFSGYYTVKGVDEKGLPILNGPVMLERIKNIFEEGDPVASDWHGTKSTKEVLYFNVNSKMNDVDSGNFGLFGTVEYTLYDSQNSSPDSNDESWELNIKMTASIGDYAYENISYTLREWMLDTTYIITQQKSLTLNLEYFQTIIKLNTADPEFKPLFRAVGL